MSRGSSPISSGSRERKMEVSPGAKKHSPRPRIPSSVSIRTNVQSKLPSTTAVFNLTIFKLYGAPDGRLYAAPVTGLNRKGCDVCAPNQLKCCMDSIVFKAAEGCRWDCLSLGEVMLRLDPGEERIHTARTFRAWEGEI